MSKSLVNKATSDDHTPPTGFALKEIATAADSGIQELEVVCNTLQRRLDKNKPAIKIKALRIIKFCCENSKPSFQQSWQRNSHILRQCTQWRGPPDAVYGDSLNEQVRKAARMCLETVNNNDVGAKREAIARKIREQSQGNVGGGMGGGGAPAPDRNWAGTTGPTPVTNTQTSSIRPAASTGRMQGFGNDASYDPSAANKETWKDKVRRKLQGSKKTDAWKQPSYDAASATIARIAQQQNVQLDARTARTGSRKKGAVGGAWGVPDPQDEDDVSLSDEPVGTLPTSSASQPAPASGTAVIRPAYPVAAGPTTAAVRPSDGTFERNFIDRNCSASGRGQAPSVTEVQKFVQQFSTMDQQVVCQLLEAKLKDGNWKSQVKVLAFVQGILNSSLADTAASYFQTNSGSLKGLANASRKSIRNKASKIMERVGLTAPAQARVSAPVEAKSAAPQGNLLDFGAPQAEATQAAQPAAQESNASGGGGFLDDILGAPAPAPQQAVAASQSSVGLLDGLSLDPQPAQAPLAPQAGPLDFLSGISPAPAPAQPPLQQQSGFGFLSKTPAQPAAPQSNDLLRSFSQPTQPQGGAFGLGSGPATHASAQASTGGFGFMGAPAQPAFGLGRPPQQSTGLAFPAVSVPANPVFGQGTPTRPPQQMQSAFGLGAAPGGMFGMGGPRQPAPSGDPFSSLINQSGSPKTTNKAATPTRAFNRGPKKDTSDKFSGLVDLNSFK